MTVFKTRLAILNSFDYLGDRASSVVFFSFFCMGSVSSSSHKVISGPTATANRNVVPSHTLSLSHKVITIHKVTSGNTDVASRKVVSTRKVLSVTKL